MKKVGNCVIVWCDLMKFGSLSVGDLNRSTEIVQRTLAAMPEKAVCFLIGPQLTSERRSCLRDEWRTVVVTTNVVTTNETTNVHLCCQKPETTMDGLSGTCGWFVLYL